ncbi:hypothetical protein ZPAH1_orf00100 [Aeromonas phage ZPAH1]|nr:hypothetical protein ZPAH1_orf00100 [Aeromonas phage ZPAH1]
MNYIDNFGVQTKQGQQLANMITVVLESWVKSFDDMSGGEYSKAMIDHFYNMCHNDSILYKMHVDYCNCFGIYPEGKYTQTPFSPMLRNQIFQIMVSVMNYEFTKYKITRQSKKG